jgi:hypothetical protein
MPDTVYSKYRYIQNNFFKIHWTGFLTLQTPYICSPTQCCGSESEIIWIFWLDPNSKKVRIRIRIRIQTLL